MQQCGQKRRPFLMLFLSCKLLSGLRPLLTSGVKLRKRFTKYIENFGCRSNSQNAVSCNTARFCWLTSSTSFRAWRMSKSDDNEIPGCLILDYPMQGAIGIELQGMLIVTSYDFPNYSRRGAGCYQSVPIRNGGFLVNRNF